MFKLLSKYSKGNLPDFMIIGAQKCGTSSLFNYLDSHEGIQGSVTKELHYFDSLIKEGYDIEWYKKQFKTKNFLGKKKLYFEATPNYMYHAQIPTLIKEVKSDTKFIIVLRNPTDRAYSAWNMYKHMFYNQEWRRRLKNGPIDKYFFNERETFLTFKEALEIELDLIENNESIEPSLIRRGFYSDQIENWISVFGREQLLILGFNELKSNLRDTINKITEFVECSPFKVSQLNHKVENKRKYDSEMSKEDREFLELIYFKPNEQLYNLLGYELNW